jgi:cellulose synthase/poly-beta-1,6-N-acetylglucosamine synthase-like glycosyltransferase
MNRSWQLSKSRIGHGNAIGGTGFCVDTKLIQEIGWTARSLTEDLEFTMQALLAGVPATWAHHAKVYDEKPTGFKFSMIQRLRWARGHWDVCTRYSPKLLYKFIRHGDFKSFDGFLYLINPGKVVIGTGVSLMLYISRFTGDNWGGYLVPFWIWLTLLVFNVLYVMYCIWSDSEQRMDVIQAVICMAIFNYTYIPLFVWGFITQRNKTWKRTEHTRSISFGDEAKQTLGG